MLVFLLGLYILRNIYLYKIDVLVAIDSLD